MNKRIPVYKGVRQIQKQTEIRRKFFCIYVILFNNPVPKYSPNITLSFAMAAQPLTAELEALEHMGQQCLCWFPFWAQKTGKIFCEILFSTLTTSFAVSSFGTKCLWTLAGTFELTSRFYLSQRSVQSPIMQYRYVHRSLRVYMRKRKIK